MRRLTLLIQTALVVVLVAVVTAPAGAHPRVQLDPTLPIDATYAATDNVEYLGRFPEHSGTASGAKVGDRFYLTDPRGVHVYDITDPESPSLLGSLPLLQGYTGVALAQEDVDTDGNILLVDGLDPANPDPDAVGLRNGYLQVVDVSDPANLEIIGTAPISDHTWTCVSAEVGGALNHCAYAYGRSGWIIDLTDPTNPTPLEQTWRAAVSYGDSGNNPYGHDLTEIKPGLVMSAGEESILMDTSDPTKPVELTRIKFFPPRFSQFGYHSVEWANGGDDPIAVLGTELAPNDDLAGSDCEQDSEGGSTSVIETFDAAAVADALDAYEAGTLSAAEFREIKFTKIDAFDAGSRGLFIDGEAPSHVLYCAHWMELHPDFDGGGKMAVSYYDRGTRFVEVAPDGTMSEFGWIVPAEGYSGSPQWITDDVVYIMDYRRGLEVVKLTSDAATGTYENSTDLLAASSTVEPADIAYKSSGSGPGLATVVIGLGLLLWALDRRRARAGRSAA